MPKMALPLYQREVLVEGEQRVVCGADHGVGAAGALVELCVEVALAGDELAVRVDIRAVDDVGIVAEAAESDVGALAAVERVGAGVALMTLLKSFPVPLMAAEPRSRRFRNRRARSGC